MKNILSIILISLALFSCKEVDKLTQFNMEFNETATIPASTVVDTPFNILTPDIATNSESVFASNDTRKDKIEEIKLTAMDLSIISPGNSDFSFLKSIEVFINADGLGETKIAFKENISNDATVVNLETTGADIKEYIKKDNFKLRFNTTTDELVSPNHEINVHTVFFVDAKVLGQ